jgi:hypothetical protein
MQTKRALPCAVSAFLLFVCPSAFGQANGSFSGTVSDKTGSVVAGATVRATSQGTGLSREVKTDGSGYYLIPLLSVADYTIQVEFQGFQTTIQKNI